jgi:hypothetical protein
MPDSSPRSSRVASTPPSVGPGIPYLGMPPIVCPEAVPAVAPTRGGEIATTRASGIAIMFAPSVLSPIEVRPCDGCPSSGQAHYVAGKDPGVAWVSLSCSPIQPPMR